MHCVKIINKYFDVIIIKLIVLLLHLIIGWQQEHTITKWQKKEDNLKN